MNPPWDHVDVVGVLCNGIRSFHCSVAHPEHHHRLTFDNTGHHRRVVIPAVHVPEIPVVRCTHENPGGVKEDVDSGTPPVHFVCQVAKNCVGLHILCSCSYLQTARHRLATPRSPSRAQSLAQTLECAACLNQMPQPPPYTTTVSQRTVLSQSGEYGPESPRGQHCHSQHQPPLRRCTAGGHG